jgi:hypothetical protein
MKRRLGTLAILALLSGFVAGGLAIWSYYGARAQAELFPGLQRKSLELEEQSDAVKGTAEEARLIEESRSYNEAAAQALASMRSRRQWAMIFSIASILLLLISVGTVIAHLKRKAIEPP